MTITDSAMHSDETASSVGSLSKKELVELVHRHAAELETVRDERDNALKAFGNSQKQLVATQVRAQIGTWERWVNSDLVYLSDQSFRMLGYKPDEISPTLSTLREIIHPDDRIRVLRSLREAEIWNRGVIIFFRICRKDGATRRLRCEFVMTEDPTGKPWRMMGVIQDLTEINVPTIAPISETDVSLAAEFCPFFIAYCDLDGELKYINRSLLEEVPAMRVGRSLFEFSTDSTMAVKHAMKRTRSTMRPCEFDIENDSQAGVGRKYNAWMGPVIQKDVHVGYVLTVLGPFGDDRARTGAHLNPESAQAIVQPESPSHSSSNVGYWARNIDADVSLWSPETFRILGIDFQPESANVETLLKVVVAADHAILIDALAHTEKTGEPFGVECRFRRPDGSVGILFSSGELVHNHLGEKLLVGTAQDITDRKSFSTSLKESELKYSALLHEMSRTHEDMLQMSRKLSTIQEEERRRLSLELHDDIGGLLSGLQILLQVQNAAASTPSLKEVSELVDDVIDRVDKMTSKLRPSSLDRLGLQSTLLSHFGEYEKLFDIKLDVVVQLPNENIISDDVKIAAYRITQEALTNLARHSGAKAGSVEIVQKSSELALSISDEGIGIAEKYSTEETDGIGLDGMKERSVLLGGTLDVISEPGSGTSIRVSLPI